MIRIVLRILNITIVQGREQMRNIRARSRNSTLCKLKYTNCSLCHKPGLHKYRTSVAQELVFVLLPSRNVKVARKVLISNGKREIVCGFFTSRATHGSEIIILHTFGFWQSLFIYISFEKPSMSGCWDSSLICTRQSRGISGTWLKPYGFSKTHTHTHTHDQIKKKFKSFLNEDKILKGNLWKCMIINFNVVKDPIW